MINKSILMSRLTDKFNLLTLHSIVNECFVNGLPINQNEITSDDKKLLTNYSYNVLKSIGGFSALENAIDMDNKSFNQNLFLANIYNICTESAKEVAKRVCDETNCKDSTIKFNDVIDKASFTEAEYKKFVSKADGIKLDEISDIIKKKTLAVIKDEQDQYEKEIALDDELKDALSESNDFTNVSNESYMDIFLDKAAPRHHITVFSRLQEAALESMNIIGYKDESDLFKVINKVTFESFIDDLKITDKSIDSAFESLANINNTTNCNVENKAKIATLVSIITYTVMETLKTMNIYCPSQTSIKNFVNAPVVNDKIVNDDVNSFYAKAEEMIRDCNNKDFSKMQSQELSNRLASLKKIEEYVQESLTRNSQTERGVAILDNVDKQISGIKSILNIRHIELKDREKATESYYDKFNKQNDISQFNKISNMYEKNPMISEIRLKISPNEIASIIDVDCANESGQVIRNSFMDMQYACENTNYINYLKDSFKNSKLANSNKYVCILINDGTGRKISLN